VTIDVACDVTNPLTGPQGASAVYGPQKGATSEMVARLDANLGRLADAIERNLGVDIRNLPGAGAAGGLGAGLVAFAGGRLRRGVDLVIDAVGLRERLQKADLCITGEGALDHSSRFGKTAVGVAGVAGAVGVPVVVLAGAVRPGARAVLDCGVTAYFSIAPGPGPLEEAIAETPSRLGDAAEQVVRLFLAAAPHAGRHQVD
jgi:glycerate kinase